MSSKFPQSGPGISRSQTVRCMFKWIWKVQISTVLSIKIKHAQWVVCLQYFLSFGANVKGNMCDLFMEMLHCSLLVLYLFLVSKRHKICKT